MRHVKTLQDCIDYADAVRKKYRISLLSIGKSPDTHIYHLSEERIDGFGHKRERLFLKKVLAFYAGLLPKDRSIFVAEVLEKHRHYPFWFMEDYREKEFVRRKDSILKKVSYAL